jgi:hypothetical protein
MMVGMNPLSLLTDLLPAKARKYVYAIAAAALFVYGLWEVSAGDVRSFVVSVVSALVATLAAANTPASRPEVKEAAEELIVEDGLYLDGHGG